MLQINCILERFQKTICLLYSGEFPKRTRHVLGETSHLLDKIRIFAECCCFLFKSFNPLHYKDFELASATAGYFCLSVSKHLKGRLGPRVSDVFGSTTILVIGCPVSVTFLDQQRSDKAIDKAILGVG